MITKILQKTLGNTLKITWKFDWRVFKCRKKLCVKHKLRAKYVLDILGEKKTASNICKIWKCYQKYANVIAGRSLSQSCIFIPCNKKAIAQPPLVALLYGCLKSSLYAGWLETVWFCIFKNTRSTRLGLSLVHHWARCPGTLIRTYL